MLVLDVNETLSDLRPLAGRLVEAGAPEGSGPLLLRRWFAQVLRDGFGLAAAGAQRPFTDLAADATRTLLHELGREATGPSADAVVAAVLEGLAGLDVHPDVPAGLRALRAAGWRLVALTNGSASSATSLLERAGVREELELVLSAPDADVWKPAPAAYAYALRRCDVVAARAVLVAVHPWDVDGAARAGLATAWLDRDGAPYPGSLSPPGARARDLVDLAVVLGAPGG